MPAERSATTPSRRTEIVYTVALALTCAVFFWSAADSGDWLAGVAAGIFLSALILNLSRYAR